VRALSTMAIKLTYSDGQESQYDDDVAWEVDDGVLKLGRKEGRWTTLLSPSHWAVIELQGAKSRDGEDASDDADEDSKSSDRDSDDKKSDSDDEDDSKDEKDEKRDDEKDDTDDEKKDKDKKDD
jgi:hypothetical protein